jgi:hypothetical protein
METSFLGSLLADDRDEDVLKMLESLSDDDALQALQGIRTIGDPGIRLAVPPLARARLARGAAGLLEDMAIKDRHIDVRDAALDALLAVAPERAARFWKPLRRRLASRSLIDAELAGWRLFEIGDPNLGPELETAVLRWPEDYYVHKSFQVLRMCIAGDSPQIIERILGHDHDRMKWLARAVWELGEEDLWKALTWAATEAPDEQCRRDCSATLAQRDSGIAPPATRP